MKNRTLKAILLCAALITVFSQSAAAQRSAKTQKQLNRKTQSVRINLTDEGYQPASFSLKKGIPARVTFVRQSVYECGEEIIIPAYNIRRTLPLNKPVTVRFTPNKTGTFDFTCGMDMLRGKLIVR